jgi:hypothetical protein
MNQTNQRKVKTMQHKEPYAANFPDYDNHAMFKLMQAALGPQFIDSSYCNDEAPSLFCEGLRDDRQVAVYVCYQDKHRQTGQISVFNNMHPSGEDWQIFPADKASDAIRLANKLTNQAKKG